MTGKFRMMVVAAVLAAGSGGAVLAQDLVDQREALMKQMGARMAPLMGMVQGRTPYDPAAAQAAADELAALAAQDWAPLFPPGSDAAALGKGRALPAIWTDMDGFLAQKQALADAAAAMSLAAGVGVDAMRAAAGPIGATCGSCHQAYRR